jgi:hypothetical protein
MSPVEHFSAPFGVGARLKRKSKEKKNDSMIISNVFLRKFSGDPPYTKFGSFRSNFA